MYTVIDEGDEFDFDKFIKDAGKALQRAANVVRTAMATPPKKEPGKKHLAGPLAGGFYSNKQRAFVIGGIKRGTLKVPYTRTANLPRSWSISKPYWDKKDLTVDVFSDPGEAPYNEWVQQDDKNADRQQVPMHEDWLTPGEAEKKYDREISRLLKASMKEWGF